MGLWDWIVSAIADPTNSPQAETRHAETEPVDAQAAVALLEEAPLPEPQQPAERWWQPAGCTQTEPLPIRRPDMPHDIQAMENLLAEPLAGQNIVLPPLPHVPQKVLTELRLPECDLKTVAGILTEDQVIAATVLRTVNSPYYRGVEPISGITSAVCRLGVNAIRTLMMHQLVRAVVFPSDRAVSRAMADILWSRALSAATIMRDLSPLTRLDPEDAFLFGLLHDIGNVVALREVHEQETILHLGVGLDVIEYVCHNTHEQLGAHVADAWNLSPQLKSLIADHHHEPSPDDPMRVERCQLQLTDMINAQLGYAPGGTCDLLASKPAIALGLSDCTVVSSTLARLPDRIDETITWM